MLQRAASIHSIEMEDIPAALAPHVDNRIIRLDNEHQKRELEEARLCSEVQHTTIQEAGESAPNTPAITSDEPPAFIL